MCRCTVVYQVAILDDHPTCAACTQVVDPLILKQYIFGKGFATEATKKKREAEAQQATLQVGGWLSES